MWFHYVNYIGTSHLGINVHVMCMQTHVRQSLSALYRLNGDCVMPSVPLPPYVHVFFICLLVHPTHSQVLPLL